MTTRINNLDSKNGGASTEINLIVDKKKELGCKTLRIKLNNLESVDDGTLKLATWVYSGNRGKQAWYPARKISDKEDHTLGYSQCQKIDGTDPPCPQLDENALRRTFF